LKRAAGGRAQSAARRGFTLLEIMIATAILTIGLVSVLALFPVAIHTGKKVVDTSTAAVIAESVAEAIREGIRNQSRTLDPQGGSPHHYFIFKHDGVRDPIPNEKSLERPDKDYFILLPRYPEGKGGTFSGGSEEIRRTNALSVAKTFVYPETDPSPNGGGNAFLADDDGDDYKETLSDGRLVNDILVEKTYPLGTFLPGDGASGATVLEDQQIESLKQYSYAFALRVSKFDGNQSQNAQQFQPANRLYNVHVMVFRAFNPPAPGKKHDEPVFDFDFEVVL
jgi:prepilin-type N-terminal cleavage/methylation domain-containing protein